VGGIKPCVSAHVGDQFENKNKHLLEKIFGYFYFSINAGAMLSTLLTPILLLKYGPHIAFGVPGIMMLIATIVFYLGRKVFIAIPPVGWKQYKKDILSPQGKKAIFSLSIMYIFISIFWSLFDQTGSIFWSLFDQTGSSWVLQAENMDKWVDLGFVRFELLASQIQAINPLLIIIMIPLFSYVIYPFFKNKWELTPLRRISIGLFISAFSFMVIAVAQAIIDGGGNPTIMYQFVAYLILTAAEVMVSITGLEFSYTQAPNSMKSFVMGLWLLSVSLGNFVAGFVNSLIQNPAIKPLLEGSYYFWFFAGLMLLTAIIFVFYARTYKEENYIQSRDGLNNPTLTEN